MWIPELNSSVPSPTVQQSPPASVFSDWGRYFLNVMVREMVRNTKGRIVKILISMVGPAGPLRVNENGHLARTETTGNRDVSLCLSHSIVSERDDGWFAAGPNGEAACFPTRQFAASVASGLLPAAAPAVKFRRFQLIREVRHASAES
jgi:hypothetical protein